MTLKQLLACIMNVLGPDRDTDERIRDRKARTIEAEAHLHRAIADEAHARGRKDSAKERKRLAESLESEAALVRLSDEYDLMVRSTEDDNDK